MAAFLLAACGEENSPAIIPSSSETTATFSQPIETPSSEPSIELSSSAPISSSSPSFDPNAATSCSITAEKIPATSESKYLPITTLAIDGCAFSVNGIQRNTGKYKPVSTIQIKKAEGEEETNFIKNVSPIHAKLTIRIYGNVRDYDKWDDDLEAMVHVHDDMTHCPTVYAGMEPDKVTTKITAPAIEGEHVNGQAYDYVFADAANYQYFKIVNENAEYTQYVESIVWGE